MPTEFPGDVLSVLGQLFEAGAEAAAAGDADTARQVLDSAETVATNKLPDGEFRDELRHGCRRTRRLLADDPPPVAVEGFAAMARAVEARTR